MSDTLDNPRAVPGDNRATLMDFYKEHNEALPGFLAEEHAQLAADVETLKGDFEVAPETVDSDEIEKQMTELGARLSKFLKLAESHRKIAKDPTLKAGQIVDNFFAGMKDKVSPLLAQV